MKTREELVRVYLAKRPGAAAHVLESLKPADSAAVLAEFPARVTGPVLAAMLYHYASRCMTCMSVDYVIKIIQQLSSHRGAALIRGLAVPQQDAVLSQLAVHHARTIRFLLSYSNNLVGAWTDPNALTVSPENTVGETRHRLQQIDSKDIHRLFLVDREHRLNGSVLISSLFQAKDETQVQSLADSAPKTLRARTSLLVAEQHTDWQQYLEMPVLNRTDEFVGIITYKTLYRALLELRHGQTELHKTEEPRVPGLTDLYRAGVHGAWQTWMELLSIPMENKGASSEHNTGRHRGT